MFCVETGEPAAVRCARLELATGVLTAATPPPPAAPALDLKQAPGAVQLCHGAACIKLDVPKLPAREDAQITYAIHASADGKRLLVTGNELTKVLVLDASTGKKQQVIAFDGGPDASCLEDAYFLGEAIYVTGSVCAGPGGTGFLFHADGKRFGEVINGVNVYGAAPLHLGGDLWAISEFGGGGFTVVDARAGKQVRTVHVESAPCDTCPTLDGMAMSVTPLVKTPSGKLVTISGSGVAVVDPTSGAIVSTHHLPVCPAKR